MNIDWNEIKKELSSQNIERIKKAKSKIIIQMEANLQELTKKGAKIQELIASTFGYNDLELSKNPSNEILLLKQEMLYIFSERYNMSLYRNASEIKAGDAIVMEPKKNYRIVYYVIKSNSKELIVKPTYFYDNRPIKEQTIKFDRRRFICGVRPTEVSLKKKTKEFFFFLSKNDIVQSSNIT